jgi:eukaryotic-like serine/threonine-protein kinase
MAEPALALDCGGPVPVSGRSLVGSAPVEPRILGDTYKLLGPLGTGGMCRVFEAEHLRLHRNVAVKLLSPEPASRPDVLERFRQEAEIISQLEHPHIVTIFDFDVTEQAEPYLVLELLRGETLEKRIEREAPLALDVVVRIITQIASALSVAHTASVVHRDLKPSNVFLTDAPGEPAFVKLLDFGISTFLKKNRHISDDQFLLGTPEYMAPEQATGLTNLIDARSDQYALAVVAYEMLTGLQPFNHEDVTIVLRRVAHQNVTPASWLVPWIPCEVDAVLRRALNKLPAIRYGDVMEFAGELAAAARHAPSILGRCVFTNRCGALRASPVSPRAAFLLSRVDDGMTVSDLLDVASMPSAEALRLLVQLTSCGAVRFGADNAAR